MIRSLCFCLFFAFAAIGTKPAAAAPYAGSGSIIATGYAWADNPTAANYTPSAAYSFNSSGEAITIRRLGIGRYEVTFIDLGGNGVAGGHVQISDYGAGSHQCRVLNWASGAGNFIVNVQCQNQQTGTALDARYNIQVSWGQNL